MNRVGVSFIPIFLLEVVVGPGAFIGISAVSSHADVRLQSDVYSMRVPAQAKNTAAYLRNHYINDSINYSVQAASYRAGQDGGDVSWDESDAPPPESKVIEQWEAAANKLLANAYFGGDFPEDRSICKVSYPDPVVAVDTPVHDDIDGIQYSVTAAPVTVDCASTTANTVLSIPVVENRLAHGNTYFRLYRFMAEEIPDVYRSLNELDGKTYSGSASSCSGYPKQDARSNAKSSARSAVQSKFSPFTDPPKGVERFDASVTPSVSVISGSVDTWTRNQCERCAKRNKDGVCEKWEPTTSYHASADAEPTGGTITVGIRDTNNTLAIADGRRHLEFLVQQASFGIAPASGGGGSSGQTSGCSPPPSIPRSALSTDISLPDMTVQVDNTEISGSGCYTVRVVATHPDDKSVVDPDKEDVLAETSCRAGQSMSCMATGDANQVPASSWTTDRFDDDSGEEAEIRFEAISNTGTLLTATSTVIEEDDISGR